METNQGNPDFRELCAELANHLQARVTKEDREIPMEGYYSQGQQLIDRARSALDKPQPPAGEVGELVRQLGSMAADAEAADFVSDAAVLDLAIKHLERLKPSRVVPPADGEVREAVAWLREKATWCTFDDPEGALFDRAADLLEQLAEAVKQSLTTEPTDKELYDLADEYCGEPVQSMRAALSRWGNRPAIPGSLHQPTDEDVDVWVDRQGFIQGHGDHPCGFWINDDDAGALVRAALTRWGRPAPQPIPVSERLPDAGDCDAEGRCWWLHIGEDGVGDWFQRAPYPSATSYAFFRMTHWLPAQTLPLPSGEVE